MDEESQATLDVVLALMGAMGSGDMDAMDSLMADDMVWQNEGDPNVPWIGPWEGKEAIFGFLEVFSTNLETTLWENEDLFASGDTAAVFGTMNAHMTRSGKDTGTFTFALRAKVRNGQIVLWNWFEDSYAIGRAYAE